jgi:single-strand DNA-binding protein
MASFNKVILMGNLTADPDVRYTGSGRAIAQLRLAVNEVYKSAEGERMERTDYFDIDVWGPQGENCGKYLSKGRPVLVEGRLRLDTWENEQKEKRSKVKVIADRVQFLGSGKDGGGGGASSASSAPATNSSSETSSDSGAAPTAPPPNSGDDEDLPF